MSDSGGGLDLGRVISFFEAIRDGNRDSQKRKTTPSRSSTQATPRFTFYSEKTGIMRASRFDSLNISIHQSDVRSLLATNPFWIDVNAPTMEEMDEISKVFGLHPLTTEDILTEDTREKCEVFTRYVFVVIKTFDSDQYKSTFLSPIPVYIVIFDECILSFSSLSNPHSRNVRQRIDQLSSYGDVSMTTEWINYALIDDITDSFIPLMTILELEVDAIEELVLVPAMKNDYQVRHLRKY